MDAEIQWIISDLTDEQLLACHHRLVLYATWLCWERYWPAGRDNLPDGFSPEAIVQEAWTRLFAGTRRWPHEYSAGDLEGKTSKATIDSLNRFMRSVIDSLVHALIHSEDAKRKGNSDSEESYKAENLNRELSSFLYQPVASPEEKVFTKETVALVRRQIADQADLLELYSHLCNGLKPAEIAIEMKANVSAVHVLIRKFARRVRPPRLRKANK